MTDLTHFDSDGNARMVDVGSKSVSARTATARGVVSMQPETARLIQQQGISKGDVLLVARLAAIMGAKRTSELIPLCHPLRIDGIDIAFEFTSGTELVVRATVRATDRTGVEMEALTAVSIAALTVYDMCKSVDKTMAIGPILLEEKIGGKSGRSV
jgi:cyclic pyranopterin phosphate synthase